MSVSVSAVPFLLVYALGKGIVDITSAVVASATVKADKLHLEEKDLKEIFNKEFETVIVDKDVLLKTLQEHGAINISVLENDSIICDCEAFHLMFEKIETDKPYKMKVSYNDDYNLNEFIENIGSEYASNAQEISYNKIKERLTSQNLEIADEEIFDDNTIVLTVNLD